MYFDHVTSNKQIYIVRTVRSIAPIHVAHSNVGIVAMMT